MKKLDSKLYFGMAQYNTKLIKLVQCAISLKKMDFHGKIWILEGIIGTKVQIMR